MKILLRITLAIALLWVVAPGDSKISEVTKAVEAFASASPTCGPGGTCQTNYKCNTRTGYCAWCPQGTRGCHCKPTYAHCEGENFCKIGPEICEALPGSDGGPVEWGCCRGCRC